MDGLMKKVYQNRFGGEAAPVEKRGNCAQACIASILELPLEETFDISAYGDDEFYDCLTGWLNKKGYHMICFPYLDIHNQPLRLPGYYIIGGTQLASGVKHVEVAYNGEIVHDPVSPNFISVIEPKEIWLIYPLNPIEIGVKANA
jgi:hypothetical protein